MRFTAINLSQNFLRNMFFVDVSRLNFKGFPQLTFQK
jgi:hypothetical protein